ncbi:MAG: methionyl-tRNA formyltransferase [Verrucomicrobia bacterium]|nr:methionyl-tRNA formyltransferase [Verrucomicrobiota bacterium]
MKRVLFMGTAELAVASLRALTASPAFELVGVVTQPDRPQGRKLQLKPSPVKVTAIDAGLKVLQPEKVRAEASLSEIRELRPDVIVVAAYGQILPKALLDMPLHGCLNVHTSLLPKYRGAAPIQWAVLNGDPETGVTIMQMDPGLDTGPMLSQARTMIEASDDSQKLHDRLAGMGATLLMETLGQWIAGSIQPIPQNNDLATHARKIEKSDGLLDWKLSAVNLWNRVRGLVPWPGAYCTHRAGDTAVLKVWEASLESVSSDGEPGRVLSAGAEGVLVRCGEGALRLKSLQREGGKRLPAREFLQGYHIQAGEVLAACAACGTGTA